MNPGHNLLPLALNPGQDADPSPGQEPLPLAMNTSQYPGQSIGQEPLTLSSYPGKHTALALTENHCLWLQTTARMLTQALIGSHCPSL